MRPQPFILALPRALFYDLLRGDITLRAMGLVYTTLLSLTPLLALSFAVLKGFGAHTQMEPLLRQLMAPLGDKAGEMTQQILGFVDNMQVGVLGVAGLVILLYTVISLMQQIEDAFNHLWHIRQGRSFSSQFRDYLSMLMAGPILLFTAVGLWTSLNNTAFMHALSSHPFWGKLPAALLGILPISLVIAAFTLTYLLIPNTRVRPLAAFGGAVFAGIVWQAGGWVFASFVVSSGQQTAVYSVFAGLFLFMLWLYVGWIIVLTGARLAYYIQFPDAVYLPGQPTQASPQTRELLAILILREIGQRFLTGQEPASLNDLRQRLPASRFLLGQTLDELTTYGILSRDDGKPAHYLLRVAPETLSLNTIRRCIWEGDTTQQQQAQSIQAAAGLRGEWLDSPDTSIQALLEQELRHKPDNSSSTG